MGICSLTLIGLGQSVAADETEPVASTTADVMFKADDSTEGGGEVTPPGPGGGGETEKPGEPGPGSDGKPGDGKGKFNIAWVSNFRFNDKDAEGDIVPITLNANGMNIWAKGTKLVINHEDNASDTYDDIPNFLQVVDNRGTLSGWKVSVTASEFGGKNPAGKDVVLRGAELSLNTPVINGPVGVTAPVAANFQNNKLVIDSESKVVMSAGEEAGTGTWSMSFGESNTDGTLKENTGVNLNIPASAGIQAQVEYKSSLTWTLQDGPEA